MKRTPHALPVNNLLGELMFGRIFKGEKLNPLWTLGVGMFAVLDEDYKLGTFGPGKRYPGLSLFREDGTEIPILFAASPNMSMTSAILTATFRAMDKHRITEQGVGKNEEEYYPIVIVDGHILRMGEEFLKYVNDDAMR